MKNWLTSLRQQINQNKGLTLTIIGIVILIVSLFSLSFSHDSRIDAELGRMNSLLGKAKDTTPTPATAPDVDNQSQPKESNKESHSNYKLEIPEINLSTEMVESKLQNNQITVPDDVVGYYKTNGGYLLVGHTPGIFQDLINMPTKISVTMNGETKSYKLYTHEITNVANIHMDYVLNHNGVVLFTCNGTKVGDSYSHRLILYYTQ